MTGESLGLSTASESVMGGAKIGKSFSVNNDTLILNPANESIVGGIKSSTIAGGVSVDSLGNPTINLPTASNSVKGGIKIGDSFDIDGDVLILEPAEDTIIGGIKSSTIAGGISVDSVGNATINLPVASDTVLGGVKSSTVVGGVQVDSVGGMTFNLGVADETLLGGVKSSSLDGGVSVNNDGTMSLNKLFYRKANTAYVVGDIVYHNALAVSQKLVCVKAGTTANSSITFSSSVEGAYITDGTAAWVIDSFADGNYSAEHQNGIYRGVNISNYWESGDMSVNIRNGVFVGMHVGDYAAKTITISATTYTDKSGTEVTQDEIVASGVPLTIAGFDSQYSYGDAATVDHHVVVVSKWPVMREIQMNPTDDTTGGYLGSDMWRVQMPLVATALENIFGSSHILTHREPLTNAINPSVSSGGFAGDTGASSSVSWTNVKVNILNEVMMFGGRINSSSAFDVENGNMQLPLYSFVNRNTSRGGFWLRSVASGTKFVYFSANGDATTLLASRKSGVLPYFLYY